MAQKAPAETSSPFSASGFQQFPLALVRIAIGWHFLYEGLTKLLDPGWTSAGFLNSSTGLLSGFFQWLASSDALVRVVDQLNIWGLIAIGLGLMLGLFTRAAAMAGVVLLAFYYLAYPPLFGPVTGGVNEGHYLIVNKNLVELFALAVVVAFPAVSWGLDSLLRRGTTGQVPATSEDTPPAKGRDKLVPAYLGPLSRRQVITSLAGVPVLGGFVLAALKKHGWRSFEEITLSKSSAVDGSSGATIKTFQFATLKDLRGTMPTGKIGNVEFSRLILGGNLIGGWAHARDLIYASKLVRAYNTREKIFETFSIAEACGVNAIITNPLLCGVMNDYWRNGGKIGFISDCGGKDVLKMIQKSIDAGACACYIQGGIGDRLVKEGNFDLMAEALELIRKNGLPAGIGGHYLTTIQESVNHGLKPDFWMKTLHRTDYWSATPTREKDNIWCEKPEETIAYMNDLKEPWIAFKILAAGAYHPKEAFPYAFENGADFICVGMYDFQIVEDVNLASNILHAGVKRQRPWCA